MPRVDVSEWPRSQLYCDADRRPTAACELYITRRPKEHLRRESLDEVDPVDSVHVCSRLHRTLNTTGLLSPSINTGL